MRAPSVKLTTVKRSLPTGRVAEYYVLRWSGTDGNAHQESLGRAKKTGGKISRAVALQKRDKKARELFGGEALIDGTSGLTLDQWKTKYLALRTDLGAPTKNDHECTLRYMAEMLGADRRVETVTPLMADEWRAWLYESKGLSDQRVCGHIRTAKTCFKRAVQLAIIARNPFTELRGTAAAPDKDWHRLDDDEVERLIDASSSPAWRALIALCAYAGLRRSEALQLTWADVQWDRDRLVVRNRTGKVTTKRKTRDTLMIPELARILLDVHETSEGDRPAALSEHNLHREMLATIERAGLPEWSSPFHTLRKWRASRWRDEQYPEHVVDAWLGHGPEVARKHYVAVSEQFYGNDSPAAVIAKQAAEIEKLTAENKRLQEENARLIIVVRQQSG